MPTFTTTGKTFGGLSLDRTVFRKLLPDARWMVYAAGWVNPNDANTATISLVYEKDDGSQVTLGSTTQAGSGKVKKGLGPFDVFGTAGVPAEAIAVVRLMAQKTAGVDGTAEAWTMGYHFLPAQR